MSPSQSDLSPSQRLKLGGSLGAGSNTNNDSNKGDRKPDHSGRKSVYVFGDSLTVSIDPYLGSGYTVDAREGRPSSEIELLTNKFKAGQFNRNSTVVVWLGTNDSDTVRFRKNMEDFLKVANEKSKARILLGKVWFSASHKPQLINSIIDRLASDYDNVGIINFPEAAKDNLAPDKIHLTDKGYKAAAKMLTGAVNTQPENNPTSPASAGDTAEPAIPGSFAEAKKYIDPQRLKEGVFFNPPLPNKAQWKMETYPNLRGFIVRDPTFQKNFAGKAPQEGDETAVETDPNLTKRQKKKKQEQAASDAYKWQMFDTNYGFRFLYNPDSFSESYSGEMSSDPIQTMMDIAKGAIPMVGTGITVQFKLLLSRFEDMQYLQQENWVDFYPPGTMSEEQRDLILKYGTMADIEYLFRMVNGNPQDTWHGQTADWGMLMPTMTIVSFGDTVGSRRLRGYINSIGYDHKMLIAGMIPVYTELNIVFNRLIDSYYDTAEADTDQSLVDKIIDKVTEVATDIYATVTGGKPVEGNPEAVVIQARNMLHKYDAAKSRVIDGDPDPETGDELDDGSFVWYTFDKTRPNVLGADYTGRASMTRRGREVQWNEVKDGDIVFFAKKKGDHPEHVAIFSGNGQVIHCTNEKNVKQPVQESFEKAAKRGGWLDRPVLIRRVIEKK